MLPSGRVWGVAVLLGAVFAGGCTGGSPGLVKYGGGSTPPAVDVPDCGTSVQVVDRPVFAMAVSAQGRVCWYAPLTQPEVDNHTSTPPRVDGDTVVLSADGQVFAYGLTDGRRRWDWVAGPPPSAEEGSYGDGPVSVGRGTVVASRPAGAERTLIGLSETRGEPIWHVPYPASSLGGPNDAGDALVFVTPSGSIIEAVSDADGAILWRGSSSAPASSSSGVPVEVFDLFAVVGSSYTAAGPDGGLEAMSSATGKLLWAYRHPVGPMGVFFMDGVLLTGAPRSPSDPIATATVALDPVSGQPLWTYTGSDPQFFHDAAGSLVVVQPGSLSPGMRRLDPRTGRTLWTISGPVYTVVGAAGRLVDTEGASYQGGTEALVGRNPATGQVEWRTPLDVSNLVDASVYAIGAPTGAVIVLQDGSNRLSGFDAATGEPKWSLQLPSDTQIDGIAVAPGGMVVQAFQSQYRVQGH